MTVFAGQMYVGSGFRRMADSLDNVLEAPIVLDFGIPRPRHRMVIPEMWDPADPMVIR